jgi:hypothetical protein
MTQYDELLQLLEELEHVNVLLKEANNLLSKVKPSHFTEKSVFQNSLEIQGSCIRAIKKLNTLKQNLLLKEPTLASALTMRTTNNLYNDLLTRFSKTDI